MFNYKSTLALGTMLLLPFSVFADTCATLPKCADLGFVNTADECGSLKKLKCPFGDAYFCSTNNCKSVKVGTLEKCTEYCADDKNVCVAKRAFTCAEALNHYCGYKIYEDGATISGTITGTICLKGTVTQATGYGSSLTFTQATVYDAGLLYDACEAEMTGRAKLDLNYVDIEGGSFFVDVDIANSSFYPSSSKVAPSFFGNSDITVYYYADTVWSNAYSPYFGIGGYGPDEAESVLRVYCEGGSTSQWSPAYCRVYVSNTYNYHKITVCGIRGSNSSSACSSGTCFNEFDVQCNGQSNPSEMCSIDVGQNTEACWNW